MRDPATTLLRVFLFRLPSKLSPPLRIGTLCVVLLGLPIAASSDEAEPAPREWTNEEDHQNMLDQLGITRLRPGANGWAKAGEPNAANYDPAKANPYPDYPDPLVMESGREVTTRSLWWIERRPEIVELFEREVIGRIPDDAPEVVWSVVEERDDGQVAGIPVRGKRLVGRVDNSEFPSISVEIDMILVTPAEAEGPVPVLMMFQGWGDMELPESTTEGANDGEAQESDAAPPSSHTLIREGWGYALIKPQSIQADNGAGLTKGIIGLLNKGQPRRSDDWGALRAWSWGAARGLDYLETDPAVDASRVGIEGVSRYGKAALVTLAFEPRFVMGLIASSGEGGVKPHRRNFGEQVENLTSSGAYHWMAGNFLKYGAEESPFGRLDADDIPVDSPQLIALCAPRLTFISYGIPEQGDALWLDQQGSYMAAVAASPVFELLGVKGLGEEDAYRVAEKPPVNEGLLEGRLAWRQHDGGHESRTNMKHFISWAEGFIGEPEDQR